MAPADLLSWPDLRDAEACAASAEAVLHAAQRRFWLAPHGRRRERLRDLQEASRAALSAEIALIHLRQESGA